MQSRAVPEAELTSPHRWLAPRLGGRELQGLEGSLSISNQGQEAESKWQYPGTGARAVVLKVWLPDQHIQHLLDTCQKCQLLGPTLDLQNPKLLSCGTLGLCSNKPSS